MSALRSLGASLRKRRLSPRSFRAVSKVAGCRWVRQYLPVFGETYLPHGQFPVRRSSHAVPFVPVSCRPMVSSQMDLGERPRRQGKALIVKPFKAWIAIERWFCG